MRIAQVAPLYECVPPTLYGGTERVVSYLTEALVRLGHEVTLFAAGGSRTAGRLHACRERPLPIDGDGASGTAAHALQVERVLQRAGQFDVLHFHTDPQHLPAVRRAGVPHLTTLHGRLDLPDLEPLVREFSDAPLVSISDAQRRPLPAARWAGTVHHGLPPGLYRRGDGSGGYLAFLGRTSPEKGLDRAVAVAAACRLRLKVAAKNAEQDRAYYEPLLADPWVDYAGQVDDGGKQALLGGAVALLFLIDWPEPFGLTAIEALACGTPVIAARRGALPEIVEDGVTGFLVDSVEEAAAAVRAARRLDRAACRARFEARFTDERMARGYLRLYEQAVSGGLPRPAEVP